MFLLLMHHSPILLAGRLCRLAGLGVATTALSGVAIPLPGVLCLRGMSPLPLSTFCSGERWSLCDLFFAARRSRRRFLRLRHGDDTTINLSVASVFSGAGSSYCGVCSVCGGAGSSFCGVVSVCGVAGTSFCGAGSRRGGEAGVVLTIKDFSVPGSSLFNFFRT